MASSADIYPQLEEWRSKVAEYSGNLPGMMKTAMDESWGPILDKAAGEVGQMKEAFLPRYFEGMMNTGYGMGTSEADLSPTQKLSKMGQTLGQFSGDLGRGQAVVDYLGGSMKDQYAQALSGLQWGAGQAQQMYNNLMGEYSLAKQLEDAAAARSAANAQNAYIKNLLSQLSEVPTPTASTTSTTPAGGYATSNIYDYLSPEQLTNAKAAGQITGRYTDNSLGTQVNQNLALLGEGIKKFFTGQW